MTDALISFGANLAGRNAGLASILANVRVRLAEFKDIGPVTVGPGFRTPAFPPGSGPDFLNAALAFPTTMDPPALMQVLHGIEAGLGRTRARRWEARVCDLDLLAMGDTVLPDRPTVERWMALTDAEAMDRIPDGLLVPHPRLHRRGFVLVPLEAVAPDWRHPILGRTVRQMRAALDPADLADIRPF